MIKHEIYKLFVIFITLIVLDYIWLANIMSNAMNKIIKNIQGSGITINSSKIIPLFLIYSIVTYIIYTYSLPNIKKDTPLYDSFIHGGILGLLIYSIYDLTNLILFNNWTFKESVLDILWGSLLFTLTGYITYKLI